MIFKRNVPGWERGLRAACGIALLVVTSIVSVMVVMVVIMIVAVMLRKHTSDRTMPSIAPMKARKNEKKRGTGSCAAM